MHSTTAQILQAIGDKALKWVVDKYGMPAVLKAFLIEIKQHSLSTQQIDFISSKLDAIYEHGNLNHDPDQVRHDAFDALTTLSEIGWYCDTKQLNSIEAVSDCLSWLNGIETNFYAGIRPLSLVITPQNSQELGLVWIADIKEEQSAQLSRISRVLLGEPMQPLETIKKVGIYKLTP